jgi:hypothetical protein
MLKFATVILPKKDNEGVGLETEHELFRNALVTEFGGWTCVDVVGGWTDLKTQTVQTEESRRYEIAAQWSGERLARLFAIAGDFARVCRQVAVMVTDSDGVAHFIEPTPSKAAPLVWASEADAQADSEARLLADAANGASESAWQSDHDRREARRAKQRQRFAAYA